MGSGFTLSPLDLGLPPKFSGWREGQWTAIRDIAYGEETVQVRVEPTGAGKSLMYVAAGLLDGGRTVILTSTKALQDQLMDDFGPIGMVTMKGRNAYPCIKTNGTVECDLGPCTLGQPCEFMLDHTCLYYKALRQAISAPLVVTNYAFWLTRMTGRDSNFGRVGFLVMDEGHSSPEVLSNFLGETILKDHYRPHIKDPDKITPAALREWAIQLASNLTTKIEELTAYGVPNKAVANKARRLVRMRDQARKLANTGDDWITEQDKRMIAVSPLWAKDYAKPLFFDRADRTLVTSATVNPKTVKMLGLEDGDFRYDESPSRFPLENRPVIHIPTVRMNYRATPVDIHAWLTRMDQIVRSRKDRKGIIHSVSYQRQEEILARAKHGVPMMGHKRQNTLEVIRKFKERENPAVLVSPSVTTGYDFPYRECEYQIVGKLPYPSSGSKIVRARQKADNEYTSYLASQQLVQMVGRGVRAEDDRCECFIVDDNIQWFMRRYSHLLPGWFKESFSSRATIPSAPPILPKQRQG